MTVFVLNNSDIWEWEEDAILGLFLRTCSEVEYFAVQVGIHLNGGHEEVGSDPIKKKAVDTALSQSLRGRLSYMFASMKAAGFCPTDISRFENNFKDLAELRDCAAHGVWTKTKAGLLKCTFLKRGKPIEVIVKEFSPIDLITLAKMNQATIQEMNEIVNIPR